MSTLPLAQLRDSRLKKIQQLRELGINPFPTTSRRDTYADLVIRNYEQYEGNSVTIAGRLMLWRKQGAMAFGQVQDQTATIQIILRRNSLKSLDLVEGTLGYADLHLLDVGDIVEIRGLVGKSQRGEISVLADELKILAKSTRPLPDKWAGLKDRESVLRRRYLDGIVNPENRKRFELITKIVSESRTFLLEKGFLEFTTPIIQPRYGGGTARPFMTHVNALGCDMYLAISHELYLKRLIIAGFDKVFTIGRYFRNEGIDRSHHPEFSMIETMTAYENYEYNMGLVEGLFRHIAAAVFNRTRFTWRGHEIDFLPPWRRMSMSEALQDVTGIDFRAFHSVNEANSALASLGITEEQTSIATAMVKAFEERVQPTLIQPTIIHGHPVEISPLAKPMPSDPRFAERFEIFIAGMECGDNWTEQNDPAALLKIWKEAHLAQGSEAEMPPLDFDFIEALEYGMPPTTGIGPGIERMAMILAEQEDIYDVIFFPMMKPVISPINRAIYGLEESEETAPVPHPEDIFLTTTEFEDLLRQGIFRPATRSFVLTPVLRLWNRPSLLDQWMVTGYVEIDGFMQHGRLIVVGYRAKSEQRPDFEDESRKFIELCDISIVQWIRELFPDALVRENAVRQQQP